MIRCGKNWLITGAEEPLNLPRSIFGTKPVLSWVGRFSLVRHASPVMRIHPVISIAQLEPSTPRPDPYDRQLVVDPSPIADGDTEAPSYEIELYQRRISKLSTSLSRLRKISVNTYNNNRVCFEFF